MTATGRVQLGWSVVESDWKQFQENVAAKWEDSDQYVIRELEDAALEFLDQDEYAPLEHRIRRVVAATGRSRGSDEEKILIARQRDGPRTTVWTSIHSDLKTDLERFATDHNLQKWQVLTAVVREYNAGGRAQRLLDQLAPDTIHEIETGLTESTQRDDTLGTVERTTIRIAQQLGDQFSEDDLADAIDAETSGSDYYHDTYRPRVIDRKGVERWEKDDGTIIFLQPDKWKARMVGEIIRELGGFETPPPPFSRKRFLRAADAVGIDVANIDKETINEYKDRVLDRLDYEWDDDAEQFGPS